MFFDFRSGLVSVDRVCARRGFERKDAIIDKINIFFIIMGSWFRYNKLWVDIALFLLVFACNSNPKYSF